MKLYATIAVVAFLMVIGGAGPAQAQDLLGAHLSGTQEVPPVYTQAHGFALVNVDYNLEQVTYSVIYFGLGSNATQAHIHFGTPGVNGGIVAFLCSNLPGKPAGVQDCPNGSGLNAISGTLTAANVVGVPAQGILAGNFDAMAEAISNGTSYVNVHTETFPAGEIRGALTP